MIRAAQVLYDFWLDFTGVTVGRYRFVVWLAHNVALDYLVALSLSSALGRVAMFAVFVAADVGYWRFVSPTWRPRAVLDDKDQGAGRHQSVNKRALKNIEGLGVDIVASLLAATFLYFVGGWKMLLMLSAFLSLDLNHCLMVRDRDATRFARRGGALAADAA